MKVLDKWRAMEGQSRFLLVGVALLLVLGITGAYGSLNDVSVTEAEAIEIAEEYLDFEPEITEARILRQGFFMQPVWGVNFRIQDPDGNSGDFLRHMTVEINGRTGDVIRVGDDQGIGNTDG